MFRVKGLENEFDGRIIKNLSLLDQIPLIILIKSRTISVDFRKFRDIFNGLADLRSNIAHFQEFKPDLHILGIKIIIQIAQITVAVFCRTLQGRRTHNFCAIQGFEGPHLTFELKLTN